MDTIARKGQGKCHKLASDVLRSRLVGQNPTLNRIVLNAKASTQ